MGSKVKRIAYVTGGMGGIGTAICRHLCRDGHTVIAGCGPGSARKERWLTAMRAEGYDVHASEGNVADWDSTRHAFEAARAEVGPIDILVNNAGATWGAATVDLPLAAWLKVINLNLTAMFLVTQEVGRRSMLPRRQGRVINVASILGLGGGQMEERRAPTLAYNTSKGGVVNFTRSLAVEWGRSNINVNAIAPGFFPTRMTRGVLEAMGDELAHRAPLQRVGGAEDLKGIVAVLASDAAAFITGQIVAVDGGVTAM
jgi:gluconate 5-dehydrogenase